MMQSMRSWFRRNAYGRFTSRLLIAVGSAVVAVLLSFLPYDTYLQAVWVVLSSMFMGFFTLRQRLNETDKVRHSRLVNTRFTFLQANDPDALSTIFADNLRPRAIQWLASETGVPVQNLKHIDALDSLSRNGDLPGQLLLRTGLQFGKWLNSRPSNAETPAHLDECIHAFILENESLLGQRVSKGVYFRHIRKGEPLATGIHMFHPESRLLLTVKYYDPHESRYSLSLSTRSFLFESNDDARWQRFKNQVREEFPEFVPARGGSGPQRAEIPFFVSQVTDGAPAGDKELIAKLQSLTWIIETQSEEELEESSNTTVQD